MYTSVFRKTGPKTEADGYAPPGCAPPTLPALLVVRNLDGAHLQITFKAGDAQPLWRASLVAHNIDNMQGQVYLLTPAPPPYIPIKPRVA